MLNSEQVIALYEALSDLSGQMLAAARLRDWHRLAELESCCARRVKALKEGAPVAALCADTRARKVQIIHQILAHDR